MVNKIGYRAAIVKLEDELYVFFRRKDGIIHDMGIPIVTDAYEHLDVYTFGLAIVSLCNENGDNDLKFEDLLEVNPHFEGITFEFEDFQTVFLQDEDGDKIPVEEIYHSDEMPSVLADLFSDKHFGDVPDWEKN